jgi:hypothetical protein
MVGSVSTSLNNSPPLYLQMRLLEFKNCQAKTLTLRALESGFFKVFLEIGISSPKLQTSNEANDAVTANNFHCQQ